MDRLTQINGTLVWYYYICQRQVWLMARQIAPDEDDPNLVIGRFLHEVRYARQRKELEVGGSKMDLVRWDGDQVVVSEVKKSSSYRQSSRMQLLHYLKLLSERGVEARGELVFPEEKRKEEVLLNPESVAELERVEKEILRLANQEQAPPPQKNRYCNHCAYREYCWA